MEDLNTLHAANQYAETEHGGGPAKYAAINDFIAGTHWRVTEDQKKIKELENALFWILQETRDREQSPGMRLYNIANKCVAVRIKLIG